MTAMKNAAHLVILGIWGVLGLVFSIHALFGQLAVVPVLSFWMWFAAFAALTTFFVGKVKGAVGALLIHGGAFGLLHLIPRVFPFSLLRLGLDLLSGIS